MASNTLTRSQRGMQIVMRTVAQWQPVAAGVRMPSQNKPGTWYTVSLDSCTCHDFEYNKRPCKHINACKVLVGRVK